MRNTIRLLCFALLSCFYLNAVDAQEAQQLRQQTNAGTVSIISGGVTGTYVRVASDLANVLDKENELRILAILGKGSVQNIDDILYLKGVDIGIVQSDVLAYVKRQGFHPTIGTRLRYITKLYNEEFHLLANKSIGTIEDLRGKKVNFGLRKSGTYMTASLIFDTLGIEIEPESFDQALALEKVKMGEIAALVYVAGKPTRLFRDIGSDERLHFLPIDYVPSLMETYLPSRLVHDDYPQLIPAGETISTPAVGAVMAVYNWKPGKHRYNKVARFVDTFFSRFEEFKLPPRHRKWQEVSLTATLPGWTRFKPAEDWLRSNVGGSDATLKQQFEQFIEQQQAPASGDTTMSKAEKARLFEEFLRWQSRESQ